MDDLSRLKALEADDIRAGRSYLVVTLTLDGALMLSRVKVLSEPDDSGWFRSVDIALVSTDGKYVEPPNSVEDESNLAGLGCYSDDVKTPLDNDRSFLDTPENLAILTQIVQRQDPFGWLRFIGEDEPEEALAKMKREVADLVRSLNDTEVPSLSHGSLYH